MTPAHHRRLAWSLAGATLIPIGVLGWLGLRVLDQERDVERERQRQELHVAGLRIAVDLERHLQAIEAALTRGEGLVFSNAGIAAISTDALLYQPTVAVSPRRAPELLEAERAEHQSLAWTRAAEAYRRLAGSAEPELRAAALLGLGRVLRKAGDPDRALNTFTDLEALGTVPVADQPAALVARQARILLLEQTGPADRLREEAGALGDALIRGGWSIDRAVFENCWELVARHAGPAALPPDSVTRTDAAIRLWNVWRSSEWPSNGRRLLTDQTASTLALWSGTSARPVVAVLPIARLEQDLQAALSQPAALVSATEADGRHLFGPAAADGLSLLPSETRLPFVLHVSAADGETESASLRRSVLVTVLALAFVLMVVAAYSLYRTTSRELRLVQQQRDFVSAVSHEFRTPLTSMRHLADLLVSRDLGSEERRTHYYHLLAHETDRLHRMVENLLSFGRIEAGAYAWRLEPLDVAALLEQVVAEFGREPLADGRDVRCDIDDDLPVIRGDADALVRAVWNLLENAAKYSARGTPIRVFATQRERAIRIGVDDRGVGIAPSEHARIFQTFVRGHDATRSRARGVGLGLALVKRVVEAHGGSVTVESEPGRGSTFTLELPCSGS